MCFSARFRLEVALKRAVRHSPQDVEYWKNALKQYDEWFVASAFDHPKVIVYTNDKPYEPQLFTWGLVPDWAKNAKDIWNQTLNARGETIFEKPSFKKSAEEQRCLIPAEGFYEHHHHKNKPYPYYIYHKDKLPLTFAGLWNTWTDKETGETLNTFSVVTTKANALMARIHNKPQTAHDHRMPVILPEGVEDRWLAPLSKSELSELLQPFPDSKLMAHTVRKLSGKGSPGNVPEANEEFEYAELTAEDNQLKLF